MLQYIYTIILSLALVASLTTVFVRLLPRCIVGHGRLLLGSACSLLVASALGGLYVTPGVVTDLWVGFLTFAPLQIIWLCCELVYARRQKRAAML